MTPSPTMHTTNDPRFLTALNNSSLAPDDADALRRAISALEEPLRGDAVHMVISNPAAADAIWNVAKAKAEIIDGNGMRAERLVEEEVQDFSVALGLAGTV